MKKLICLSLVLAMASISFSACGAVSTSSDAGGNTTEEVTSTEAVTTVDPTQYLQDAYDGLVQVSTQLDSIAYAIQGSWHYGIYEQDDASFYKWSLACGLDSSDLQSVATEKGYSEAVLKSSLADFNTFIGIAMQVMKDNGMYSDAEKALNDVKTNIKSATNDLDEYDDIKNYYTSTLAYYEYLESPTGNFSQMTETISDYQNELKEFKNDLSFEFGSDFDDDFDSDDTTIDTDDII